MLLIMMEMNFPIALFCIVLLFVYFELLLELGVCSLLCVLLQQSSLTSFVACVKEDDEVRYNCTRPLFTRSDWRA